jgi:murein DD-endopeptidase MepM/ murein hydrolase activator NlpD
MMAEVAGRSEGGGVIGREAERLTQRTILLLAVLLIGVLWAASACSSPAPTTTLATTGTAAVRATTTTAAAPSTTAIAPTSTTRALPDTTTIAAATTTTAPPTTSTTAPAASNGPVPIVFPLASRVPFEHEYLDPRSGHLHQGIDLFAPKMAKEVAVVSGTVTLQVTGWSGGPWYALWLAGDDGHGYSYSHLNNDTPGTDNGKGGVRYAFAAGLVTGSHVHQGQVIAYCGDSGNAEVEGPQLHFEIHETTSMSSPTIDPYDSLYSAPLANGAAPPAWPVPALSRYEQSSSKITYIGAWSTATQPGASGGSAVHADSNARALIWFEGTRLDLIATKAADQGNAWLSLDGGPAVAVDLYSPTMIPKQAVWSTGVLTQGTHTVSLLRAGESTAAGGGTGVNIDALEVTGKLIQAPALTTSEQSSSLLKYRGAWTTSASGSDSGGSLRRADSPGASVTAQFSGVYVAWMAGKGPGYGQARLTLDGGKPVTVDLHSASTLCRQQVWSSGVMDDGTHVLKIEWMGVKNPAASGTSINLDALQLIGALDSVGSKPWWGAADFATIPPPSGG